MPLTGALQADFSDFIGEADKAAKALGAMDAEAKKTGTTMAKTGQQVDGFGKDNNFTVMAKELRTVDQSMAAVGLSINPVINMLGELGTVVTRTATSLSLLEKGSVVLATAMAAWQVGRWIADLGGLDDKFAELGAMLRGEAGPAAEAFGNRIETVRRAILAGGTDVQTYEQAVAYLTKKTKDYTESLNTSTHRVSIWNSEIEKAATAGHLQQIQADLESQNSTLQQLAKHYNISVEALQFLQREMAKAATVAREYAEADKKAAAEAKAHAEARQKLQAEMFGTDAIAKAQQYAAALGPIENLTRMSAEAQKALNTTVGQAIEAYGRMGEVAPQALRDIYLATLQIPPVITGLGTEFANVGTQFTVTADAVVANMQKMRGESAAYEAETQRMVDAAQQIAPPIAVATDQTKQLTVAFQQATSAIQMTAAQAAAAGAALKQAYVDAGIFVGMQGGAMTGYQASRRAQADREVTGAGQAWGNTLNVNVNSTEAGNISKALVDEMRRNGVRF